LAPSVYGHHGKTFDGFFGTSRAQNVISIIYKFYLKKLIKFLEKESKSKHIECGPFKVNICSLIINILIDLLILIF
jgi:hypothetical protein